MGRLTVHDVGIAGVACFVQTCVGRPRFCEERKGLWGRRVSTLWDASWLWLSCSFEALTRAGMGLWFLVLAAWLEHFRHPDPWSYQ